MPFIAFLGCDGSGKSAVIHGVTARLEADGHPVTLGHWRPKPFASPSSGTPAAADDPHGQLPRGFASSILKLGWLWLNWWAAWFLHLRRESRSGFVLFDRYHGDLLVDPKRYRYGGPLWLARLASRLMPQPDLVIFLDAEPDVLLSRKQEVGRDSLEAARREYLEFCDGNARCRIIDASQPLEPVISTATNTTIGTI
jgi:thymidylate kinase